MLFDIFLKNSNIPERYKRDIPIKPAKQDTEAFKTLAYIKKNIEKFVFEGQNLLICSNNCGNGKTTSACKLATEYMHTINATCPGMTPVLFVNVQNLLNEKKLAINDKALANRVAEIERHILSAKLVVFDDIADKTLSEYDMNSLYYWIDSRTSQMKSCIYTSNQLPEALEASLSGKVYSRIVNYATCVTITDGDHRKREASIVSTNSNN